jgi:hypothetical protein
MSEGKVISLLNGPLGYQTEAEGIFTFKERFVFRHDVIDAIASGGCISFAHVVNVHPSEEGWLADATELFLPEFFAKRLVGDETAYLHRGAVWEHMREEIYRMAFTPNQCTLESIWRANYMLYCFERNDSYADELFGEPFGASFAPYHAQCDGCEDEPEEDTLDSELLLTQEYISPEEVLKIKESLWSTRPGNTFSPIESEEQDGYVQKPR